MHGRYGVLRVCAGTPANRTFEVSGGHSERDTPLPIPNRVVKPLSADGTWGASPWESRSPPDLHQKGPSPSGRPLCVKEPGTVPGTEAAGRRTRMVGREPGTEPGSGLWSAGRLVVGRFVVDQAAGRPVVVAGVAAAGAV